MQSQYMQTVRKQPVLHPIDKNWKQISQKHSNLRMLQVQPKTLFLSGGLFIVFLRGTNYPSGLYPPILYAYMLSF